MAWHAAHVVMYLRFRDGVQDKHYVMENIVLVQADSREELMSKAEQKARDEYAADDPSFMCDGRPAYWEYRGVRKYVDCEDATEAPRSGTELTYLEYRLQDAGDLAKLLGGEDVMVEFDGGRNGARELGG